MLKNFLIVLFLGLIPIGSGMNAGAVASDINIETFVKARHPLLVFEPLGFYGQSVLGLFRDPKDLTIEHILIRQ